MRALIFFLVIAFAGLLASLVHGQTNGDLILQFKGSSGASLQYLTPSTGTGIPAFNGASPNRLELLPRSTFSTPADVAAYAQPLDSDLTTLAGVTSGTTGRSLLGAASATAAKNTLGIGTSGGLVCQSLQVIQGTAGSQPGYFAFIDSTQTYTVRVGYNGAPTSSFDIELPTAGGTWLTSGSSLNADNIASGSLALARIAQGGATSGQAMVWNGTAWAPGSVTAPVTSVAGRTGAITLSNSDISGLGTLATQAANNVTITGGSINGVTEFITADADFTVDTYGNLTSRYWKLKNNASNSVALELSVVSGAVPSTAGSFVEVVRMESGVAKFATGGTAVTFGGPVYLGGVNVAISGPASGVLQLGNNGGSSQTLRAALSTGTNTAGQTTYIQAYNGTGTGGSGALEFQTAPSGSSGSTPNTQRTMLKITKDNVVLPVVPTSSAGQPSGAIWNDAGTLKIVP